MLFFPLDILYGNPLIDGDYWRMRTCHWLVER